MEEEEGEEEGGSEGLGSSENEEEECSCSPLATVAEAARDKCVAYGAMAFHRGKRAPVAPSQRLDRRRSMSGVLGFPSTTHKDDERDIAWARKRDQHAAQAQQLEGCV